MKRILTTIGLSAVTVVAVVVSVAPPANALGGDCNGMVDVGCQQCFDYSKTPPQPVNPWYCENNTDPERYRWSECTVYGGFLDCVVG